MDALEDNDIKYETLIIEEDEDKPEIIADFLDERLDFNKKNLVFVPNCWALPTVFLAMKYHRKHMPYLGLIGFDNLEWVNFSSPSVTTIVQPAVEEGIEVAKIIIDQIEEKNEIDLLSLRLQLNLILLLKPLVIFKKQSQEEHV